MRERERTCFQYTFKSVIAYFSKEIDSERKRCHIEIYVSLDLASCLSPSLSSRTPACISLLLRAFDSLLMARTRRNSNIPDIYRRAFVSEKIDYSIRGKHDNVPASFQNAPIFAV